MERKVTQNRMEEKLQKAVSCVVPGCVWDWSRPTLWLLRREILCADWCLVARRQSHLGRSRHCCRWIWSWVIRMEQQGSEEVPCFGESIHPGKVLTM